MTITRHSENAVSHESIRHQTILTKLNPENRSPVSYTTPDGENKPRFVSRTNPDRQGGAADIYYALEISKNPPKTVVLKTLRTDKEHKAGQPVQSQEELTEQFIREAQVLQFIRSLSAPEAKSVVECHEVFHLEGQAYMVLQCLDPQHTVTLRDLIQDNLVVSPEWAVSWVSQLCATVDLCAQEDILHADINPRNLLLDVETQTPYLIDFGISPTVVEHRADWVQGTLGYIAPERLAGGPPTLQSEVFALTVSFYEMLTGTYLYYLPDKNYKGMINRTLNNQFIYQEHGRLKQCVAKNNLDPEAVEYLFTRGLAKNPEDPFQTAAELAQACECIFTVHKKPIT